MSPIDQMACRIQFKEADYRGFFTPPRADKRYVEYPAIMAGPTGAASPSIRRAD